MGSDEAKTAVNGVVDPAADATNPSKSATNGENPDISDAVSPDGVTTPGGATVAPNGSPAASPANGSAANGSVTNGALGPVTNGAPTAANPLIAQATGDNHTWYGDAAGNQDELSDADEDEDEEWVEDYHDLALFSSIFSAPSLALAGFVFALTGLLGGMIPESLPYLVQIDPTQGPAYHVRIVGLIALGFAIIAASLGLAAMLRSIGSPLRWPRYLGGAAVLLALLIALQAVLLIGLAGLSAPPGMS